jgi:inner membrane transporter RhtA
VIDTSAESAGSRLLSGAPPEMLFVLSAAAQYTGAVVAVNLFDQLSPATIAWIRVLSAGIVLTLLSGRWSKHKWTLHDVVWAGAFGTATALMNMFFYLALDHLPLGKGVTIEFIGPITVAAVMTRSARNTCALVFATAGVVVLGGVELGNEPLGLVFILAASAMWAAYIVVGSKVALANRGVAGLGIGLIMGGIIITPIASADASHAFSTPSILFGCILIGMLSNVVGYGIDQYTFRRIPVRRFSVMLALLPVTAAIFGFLFLRQTPTILDLVGMTLVLVGVGVQERDVIERHHPESQTA